MSGEDLSATGVADFYARHDGEPTGFPCLQAAKERGHSLLEPLFKVAFDNDPCAPPQRRKAGAYGRDELLLAAAMLLVRSPTFTKCLFFDRRSKDKIDEIKHRIRRRVLVALLPQQRFQRDVGELEHIRADGIGACIDPGAVPVASNAFRMASASDDNTASGSWQVQETAVLQVSCQASEGPLREATAMLVRPDGYIAGFT